MTTLVDQCCKRSLSDESSQKIWGSHHRHRPGRDVFSRPCGNSVISFCELRGGLLRRPVELGPVDPHSVQNDSKLSSDGNLGFAQPASLRKPDAPGFERRPLCYTGEQHVGCLIEVTSQHLIAAFRDSARPVDLAGCVSSGRQSDVGSDTSRLLEARGVIDRRKEAKSRDWADAGCCHKPSHLSIIARQPHHLAVEVRNLPPDSLACLEQRLYRGSEFWPSLGQLRGAHGKHVHLCLTDDKPEILEEPADLVLNIPLDLDEQSSADKKGFDRVAVEIFDADLLLLSTLHDACDAHGVVTIALVDTQLQSSLRMPRIDTDDGQSQLTQLGP